MNLLLNRGSWGNVSWRWSRSQGVKLYIKKVSYFWCRWILLITNSDNLNDIRVTEQPFNSIALYEDCIVKDCITVSSNAQSWLTKCFQMCADDCICSHMNRHNNSRVCHFKQHMIEAIGGSAGNAIQGPIQAACRDVLIPSFDRGLQNVCQQINQTFHRGTQEC